VFVTVKVTLVDVWSGESNVASLPDGAQLALTPSSSQAYAVVDPPVPVSVMVHVVPGTLALKKLSFAGTGSPVALKVRSPDGPPPVQA
jgi:hypothetical protein